MPILLLLLGLVLPAPLATAREEDPIQELEILTWNIWRGGREDGEELGPRKVAEVIRRSGADVVAMQETYGSGEWLASELGFHFHPRGTNVSIHSRWPVLEDLSVHEEFQCVGALLDLPGGERLAFYSIWLPYSAEIWVEGTRDVDDPGAMLAACEASRRELETMLNAIEERLADERYAGVPVVIAGDFNSMSHLDYGEVGMDQYEVSLSWPTSHLLHMAGFRDAYRETNPVIDRVADSTWTPRFPEQEQDRIDFVFHRSDSWVATSAAVLREHPQGFPSDHAAVLARLERRQDPPEQEQLRVASYNIKHGVGMDGSLDLARTAEVLRGLEADVVALQEVDLGCSRSGGRNQVLELAHMLGMHPAFGSFMEYQGGHYGMALLSRHPLVDALSVRLPDGNEPRVALRADLRLPDGRVVSVVDIHLDWVADDGLRFGQAEAVAEHLRGLEHPWILLGDFNDQPGSRTLELFDGVGRRLEKQGPAGSLTFPSDEPRIEIDFLYCSPGGSWRQASSEVIPETRASDHRPVLGTLELGSS